VVNFPNGGAVLKPNDSSCEQLTTITVLLPSKLATEFVVIYFIGTAFISSAAIVEPTHT